jgi:hypothetical protein
MHGGPDLIYVQYRDDRLEYSESTYPINLVLVSSQLPFVIHDDVLSCALFSARLNESADSETDVRLVLGSIRHGVHSSPYPSNIIILI